MFRYWDYDVKAGKIFCLGMVIIGQELHRGDKKRTRFTLLSFRIDSEWLAFSRNGMRRTVDDMKIVERRAEA